MTRSANLVASAALAVALTVFAGSANAQSQSGGRPDLSSILRLRPDQQGALRTYQASTQTGQMDQGQAQSMSPQALASLPTPARLDRIAMFLRLQMTRFQRNAEATRAFYGQLSPDQQRTFDQITAPPTQARRPPQG